MPTLPSESEKMKRSEQARCHLKTIPCRLISVSRWFSYTGPLLEEYADLEDPGLTEGVRSRNLT